ncbi:hypothetical protein LL06_13530 [Hoeflea sp. BAL378]|uniref:DUF4198 domain-containing protein n=1 Tax=Hoeflea sp. BAL378 TaxID=1547437 RepID=UPI000513A293|nr:DUF4198 domain-containing protein [Hoeflea sp. BAL378]KGF68955.1 hypothetical protein LL06_13530 [Hoeflea sp. BAL378]
MRRYPARCFAILGLMLAWDQVTPAAAHEFWIEPQDFSVAAGEEISADIRIGQDFKGDAFPYIPSRFAAFRRHDRDGETDVAGTTGDLPALKLLPRTEGLTIFTYVSVAERIRFQDWEKFAFYLDYEGLDAIPDLHAARGLARDDIRELYTRCAKALVTVGDAAEEQDRATGMRLELVAAENPATLSSGKEIGFTLLWEGAPLADTQVALFRRGTEGGAATRVVARTDETGLARFPLPAAGTYLASSVHMIEAPADRNADWESYWASLTFAVE